MKLASFVLGVLVGACLYISADRLYQVVSGSNPPGKVGECLNLNDGKHTVQGRVVSNDRKNKTSILNFHVGDIWIQQQFSFEDQRDLHAKRVNCDE